MSATDSLRHCIFHLFFLTVCRIALIQPSASATLNTYSISSPVRRASSEMIGVTRAVSPPGQLRVAWSVSLDQNSVSGRFGLAPAAN